MQILCSLPIANDSPHDMTFNHRKKSRGSEIQLEAKLYWTFKEELPTIGIILMKGSYVIIIDTLI